MGSSGAGKTTLINILTMIEDYDEGEISFSPNHLGSIRIRKEINTEKRYKYNFSRL